MHTRDVILLQSTALTAAILITYLVLVHPISHPPKHHTVPRVLVSKSSKMLNFTRLVSCHTVPNIQLYLFAKDANHVRRLVQSLNAADYGPATANLTIFGDRDVVQKLEMWEHGGYRFFTRSLAQLRLHDEKEEQLVIVFGDEMDPSPLYAMWFLIQRCAHANTTAIAGGRESGGKVSGLAMSMDVWNSFINAPNSSATTDSVLTHISNLPNASMIIPSTTGNNHAFVRAKWQNPAYVEHDPKLMRSWDPAHKPVWEATELML